MTDASPSLPGRLRRWLFASDAAPTQNIGFARRQIEGFAVAIAMALVLKQFTFDAFQVPTESMEPAIIGRGEMGDRIVIDRFAFLNRDPERYEICVFKYPLSRLVNYVKRAVGMPGDHLRIWRGQIFAAPNDGGDDKLRITRKPDAIQDAIFKSHPVVVEEDMTAFDTAKLYRNWVPNDGGSDRQRQIEANAVVADATSGNVRIDATKGPRYVLTKEPITDSRHDSKAADALGRNGGHDAVGDLRLAITVTPAGGAGAIVLQIDDPTQPGQPIRLECAVGDTGQTRVLHGTVDVSGAAFATAGRLKPGTSHDVVLENVDYRINVEIDGTRLLQYDYDCAPVDVAGPERESMARIGVMSGAATFSKLGIYRDLYYTQFQGVSPDFHVPANPPSYLMLGDNSPNSLDGRGWRRAAIRIRATGQILTGDAEAVSDRVENTRRFTNPWQGEDDMVIKFLDVQGNQRTLAPGSFDILDATTLETAFAEVREVKKGDTLSTFWAFDHFVPRSYIIGRAAVVFFPRLGFVR